MKTNNWAAALSLSVGVSMLAGCGQSPAVPTTRAPAANAPAASSNGSAVTGGMAAQEGVGATTPAAPTDGSGGGTTVAAPSTTVPSAPSTVVSAAPAGGGTGTTPGAMPGAMPSGAPAAPGTPGMPGAPGAPGQPGAPGAVSGPGAPGTGVLGDARIGGVVGGIPKVLDRGLGAFVFAAGDLVAFQSDRATGGGNNQCEKCDHHHNYDIFVYDALAQTVLAIPGVNTFANEVNPRLSSNGQFLVYQTDENGSEDIRVFDMANQLIDTLRDLNTVEFDEMEPDISDDGNLIVYVSDEPGGGTTDGCDNLRLYNTHNAADYIVPVANRGLRHITWPSISGNGAIIAYGASGDSFNRQIFIYSVPDAAQLTPPFINAVDADNYNPDLNELGDRVAFVSNRRGSEDIYMTDLRSGFTDNLVLANSTCTEQEPRFLGPDGSRIVFQSDRTGNFMLYAYDLPTALLDTLPVANYIGADTQLRDFHPHLPAIPHHD